MKEPNILRKLIESLTIKLTEWWWLRTIFQFLVCSTE